MNDLDVVGGTYQEICQFPQWRQFYGSGGRAAAALARLGAHARLTTFGSDRTSRAALADACEFQIREVIAAPDVQFDYFHALTPIDNTPREFDAISPPPSTTAHTVLQFGTLEGPILVDAEQVVYDPQNSNEPAWFRAFGSSNKRLAIVCNLKEGQALSGAHEPHDVGRRLLDRGADAVVVKAGVQGAFAFENGKHEQIGVYPTDRVFPLGSGDVFSATFAKGWLLDGQRAADAADFASRATALYCRSRSFPTTAEVEDFQGTARIASVPRRPRVYLAGPFFSMSQLWMVEEARAELRSVGLEVVSPFHDVGTELEPQEIARKDLTALVDCDSIFALLDGLDTGTIFEVGYAARAGISSVAYGADCASLYLTMLEGTGCELIDDFATAVYRAAWRAYGML